MFSQLNNTSLIDRQTCYSPFVLIATAVVNSVMTFMPRPALNMSYTDIVDASKTMAFGAVATGNMNA